MNIGDELNASLNEPRRFKIAESRPDRRTDTEDGHLDHIVGFGPMSRITTSFGAVHAQTLREGDLVRTKVGDYLKIVAINRITIGNGYLKYHPGAQPIVIRSGAFGSGLPVSDLTLAPNQKITAGQRFMQGNIKRAIDAVGRSHVYRRPEEIITYTIFHCGKRAAVLCEGIWIDTAP